MSYRYCTKGGFRCKHREATEPECPWDYCNAAKLYLKDSITNCPCIDKQEPQNISRTDLVIIMEVY